MSGRTSAAPGRSARAPLSLPPPLPRCPSGPSREARAADSRPVPVLGPEGRWRPHRPPTAAAPQAPLTPELGAPMSVCTGSPRPREETGPGRSPCPALQGARSSSVASATGEEGPSDLAPMTPGPYFPKSWAP